MQDILNLTHDEVGRLVGRGGIRLVSLVSGAVVTVPRVLGVPVPGPGVAGYVNDPLAAVAVHNGVMGNSGFYGIGQFVTEHPSRTLGTDRYIIALARCWYQPVAPPVTGVPDAAQAVPPGTPPANIVWPAGINVVPVGNQPVAYPIGIILIWPVTEDPAFALGQQVVLPLLFPHVLVGNVAPFANPRPAAPPAMDVLNRCAHLYAADPQTPILVPGTANFSPNLATIIAPPDDPQVRSAVLGTLNPPEYFPYEAVVRPIQYKNFFIIPTRVSTLTANGYNILQSDLILRDWYTPNNPVHEFTVGSNTLPSFNVNNVMVLTRVWDLNNSTPIFVNDGPQTVENGCPMPVPPLNLPIGVTTDMALYRFEAPERGVPGSRDNLDTESLRVWEERMTQLRGAQNWGRFPNDLRNSWPGWRWAFWNVGMFDTDTSRPHLFLATMRNTTDIFTNFPQDAVIRDIGQPLRMSEARTSRGVVKAADPVRWQGVQIPYFVCSGMAPRVSQPGRPAFSPADMARYEDLPYTQLSSASPVADENRWRPVPNDVRCLARYGMWKYRFAWEFEDGSLSAPSAELVVGDLLWSATTDVEFAQTIGNLTFINEYSNATRTQHTRVPRAIGYQRMQWRNNTPEFFSPSALNEVWDARWGAPPALPRVGTLLPPLPPAGRQTPFLGMLVIPARLAGIIAQIKSNLYHPTATWVNDSTVFCTVYCPHDIQLVGTFGVIWDVDTSDMQVGYVQLAVKGWGRLGLFSLPDLVLAQNAPPVPYSTKGIFRWAYVASLPLSPLNGWNPPAGAVTGQPLIAPAALGVSGVDSLWWLTGLAYYGTSASAQPMRTTFASEGTIWVVLPGYNDVSVPGGLGSVIWADGLGITGQNATYLLPTFVRGVDEERDRLDFITPARPVPGDVLSRLFLRGHIVVELIRSNELVPSVLVASDGDFIPGGGVGPITSGQSYLPINTQQPGTRDWTFLNGVGSTSPRPNINLGTPLIPRGLTVNVYFEGVRLTLFEQLIAAFPSAILFRAPRLGLAIPAAAIPPRAKRLWIFRTLPAIHNDYDGDTYHLVAKVDIPWQAGVQTRVLDPTSANVRILQQTGQPVLYFFDNVPYDEVDTSVEASQYEGMTSPLASLHAVALNERVYYANFAETAQYEQPYSVALFDNPIQALTVKGDGWDQIAVLVEESEPGEGGSPS